MLLRYVLYKLYITSWVCILGVRRYFFLAQVGTLYGVCCFRAPMTISFPIFLIQSVRHISSTLRESFFLSIYETVSNQSMGEFSLYASDLLNSIFDPLSSGMFKEIFEFYA